jgi:hypothetical protein
MTIEEAEALAAATTTHCTCASAGPLTRRIHPCGACALSGDPLAIRRLVFYRRLAPALRDGEHAGAA